MPKWRFTLIVIAFNFRYHDLGYVHIIPDSFWWRHEKPSGSVTENLSNMWLSSLRSKPFRASSAGKLGREQKTLQISDWGGAASISHRNCAPPQPFLSVSLVPSRYLSVFWGETRLGIKLRIARGLMGRVEGKIAPSGYSVKKASMIFKNSPNLRPWKYLLCEL